MKEEVNGIPSGTKRLDGDTWKKFKRINVLIAKSVSERRPKWTNSREDSEWLEGRIMREAVDMFGEVVTEKITSGGMDITRIHVRDGEYCDVVYTRDKPPVLVPMGVVEWR